MNRLNTHHINRYSRYQKSFHMGIMFPDKKDGLCGCGCGRPLPPRKKRWYSKQCQLECHIRASIIKGDSQMIRRLLFILDEGFCRACGVYDENWQADHILPVHKGGGGSGLENYQTLCVECHKAKTYKDVHCE